MNVARSQPADAPAARSRGGTAADDPQNQARMGAFLPGLQQLGWIDGRSVRIDTRWPAGRCRRHTQIRGGIGRAFA